jgi:hypothetical protein
LDTKIRILAADFMSLQINACLDGNIHDKILLLLLKIRTYACRIFNTKTRILTQAPEFLQPIYLLDPSNGSTAGYTENKTLLQLSKIRSGYARIFGVKIKLIRPSLHIS